MMVTRQVAKTPDAVAGDLVPPNALVTVREEIRYRLELYPWTTVNDAFVELDVVSGM